MILTSLWQAQLKKPDSCYIIRCCISYCLCDKEARGCEVGFFSLFIRALYGIRLATKYDVPYYVDFGSILYRYSDPKRFEGDPNFWNYYFCQSVSDPLSFKNSVVNTPYETFPVRIWNRSHFREMHFIIRDHIKLQPNIEQLVKEKKHYFRQQKTLGVHIRRTDHPIEVEPILLDTFKRVIYREIEIQHYDKIFIATDDVSALEVMISEFGQRIIYNEAKRSTNKIPVHHHPFENRYELGLEALLDAYCLSFCQKTVLLHSNLSYTALLFNPALEYILLETPKHRNMRFKTLVAYRFDRFGIRIPKR